MWTHNSVLREKSNSQAFEDSGYTLFLVRPYTAPQCLCYIGSTGAGFGFQIFPQEKLRGLKSGERAGHVRGIPASKIIFEQLLRNCWSSILPKSHMKTRIEGHIFQ